MRKWIIGAFTAGAALAGGYAIAQIVSALPFQLQNGTTADATQVMANFNQLLNGINTNAAKNGANSDITSLLALTTPIAPSVGGTTTFTGGTSTGSANAQVLTPVVPSTFTLAVGTHVVFIAGFTNSGGATLDVSSSSARAILRTTQLGISSLVGGELTAGSVVEVVYDGTFYQLVGAPITVGTPVDYIGSSAPPGWIIADGSCVSQSTYSALFNIAGTGWGSCGAGNFALPDYNGRIGVAKDNSTGRITTACAGGNTLATGCGAQNQTIAQANLPSVNFAVTDTRTWTTATSGVIASGAVFTTTTLGSGWSAGTVAVTPSGSAPTAASGGSGTALTTFPPVLVVNKIIKL